MFLTSPDHLEAAICQAVQPWTQTTQLTVEEVQRIAQHVRALYERVANDCEKLLADGGSPQVVFAYQRARMMGDHQRSTQLFSSIMNEITANGGEPDEAQLNQTNTSVACRTRAADRTMARVF